MIYSLSNYLKNIYIYKIQCGTWEIFKFVIFTRAFWKRKTFGKKRNKSVHLKQNRFILLSVLHIKSIDYTQTYFYYFCLHICSLYFSVLSSLFGVYSTTEYIYHLFWYFFVGRVGFRPVTDSALTSRNTPLFFPPQFGPPLFPVIKGKYTYILVRMYACKSVYCRVLFIFVGD